MKDIASLEHFISYARRTDKCIPQILQPKASDIAVVLPSTSMAAHAADEDVEVVDMEDKLEVAGKGTPSGIPEYPFLPPPPPLPPGACLQVSSITEPVHI